ncbi:hex2 protein [Phlyctema vagabunda]|uniref:Hex2 protein n=1 Tax=Phlyctema vagabunda TaxID=108571 RepID=A0ABR4PD26_9HELO
MAVVLNAEENSYFSSSNLRRSHSQPKFGTPHSSYTSVLSKSRSSHAFNTIVSPSNSPESSAPSSPRTLTAESTSPSYASTPASSMSLDAHCEDVADEDQIVFPSYDEVGYYGQVEDLEPPASPRTGDSYTVSTTSNSTSTNVSRPGSPDFAEHAEDDTAIRIQPSRHVDYLSHNWKEEDIWSSWKHIVSKRKAYNNSARLENASWRTWIKAKNNLKTVSPETLNWLKDCDVTWLYGPLQCGTDRSLRVPGTSSGNSSRISKSNSFLNKKPILKKRSMSEIMLQRSLSASSLLKQAAAAVQAQQNAGEGDFARPSISRATSDYVTFPFSSRRLSRENTSTLSSINSSGLVTPGTGEKKHIHFNEQVEQCIALEMKGDDEDVDAYAVQDYDDSDSDDGGIMMKRTTSKHKLPPIASKKPANKATSNVDSKTIAMLPSTTLKYREDTPEPQETAMKHSNGYWNGTKLSPSPSQETLRPSKPSSRMLLADDEEDDDADMDWQPPSAFANRKDSMAVSQDRMHHLQSSGSSSSLNGEPSGMRRTPSGMFMPYEEDEDDVVSEGLFGKVVDTVNTAKDIAHVIWNVGWRR